jgi:hypothetical protein
MAHLICKRCRLRAAARDDQIGTRIECPECGHTGAVVPAPVQSRRPTAVAPPKEKTASLKPLPRGAVLYSAIEWTAICKAIGRIVSGRTAVAFLLGVLATLAVVGIWPGYHTREQKEKAAVQAAPPVQPQPRIPEITFSSSSDDVARKIYQGIYRASGRSAAPEQ